MNKIEYLKNNISGELFKSESFPDSKIVDTLKTEYTIKVIRYFPIENIYVSLLGYTSSYQETDWDLDSYSIVEPKLKTVTTFE